MLAELLRTGLPAGRQAPDFELPTTSGTRMRSSDLRGHPVLLHFVSYTCPVTRGGVHTMRELHQLYGDRVEFVEAQGAQKRGKTPTWGCLPEIRAVTVERETGFEPATFCLGTEPSGSCAGADLLYAASSTSGVPPRACNREVTAAR